ncbi:TPA: transcriptional regulator [Vibrio parahaemolyticus]
MKKNQRQSIKKAVYVAGTQEELAKAAGVSQQMISKLLNNPSLPISSKTAVAIELATKGKVSRKELKPDDWFLIWPELRGTQAH